MKKNNLFLCVIRYLVFFLFLFTKIIPLPHRSPPKVTTGVYVLNQGFYGANNTTLTYYDFTTSTPTTDLF